MPQGKGTGGKNTFFYKRGIAMVKAKKCLFLVFMLFLVTTMLRAEDKAISVESRSPGSADQKQMLSEDQPRISFEATSYDAGEVREGDAIHHSFKVKNTGKAPLEIQQVKPG